MTGVQTCALPISPFVGRNFNVTRAGIHADGLLKNGKKKRRGMKVGKTAKTKKAIVQLTADSADIEIFAGL